MNREPRSPNKLWTGLSATRETVGIALVGADGGVIEHMLVHNELQAVVRVIRRWKRVYGFDPAKSTFCAPAGSPWLGAVLEGMLEIGWEVVVLPGMTVDGNGDAPSAATSAADLVRMAMDPAMPKETMSLHTLRSDKLDRLRERREELAALRSGLQAAGGERNHHLEMDLQRELDRMDRRHVQLIEKLLARLDTLIGLQLRGPS